MIRTFLFDMGNVLVMFSHQRMCEQIGALCGWTGDEVRRILFDSGLQWELERGRISERDIHRRLEGLVGQTLNFQEFEQAGSDIFELNRPIVTLLDELKSRGHRLVLLSNTSRAHFEFIRREFDVLERFDAFVLSYEAGAIKPESAIFEAALERIACAPEECFYTDDIADYVERARRFGLQAEVFVDVPTLVQQLAPRGVRFDRNRPAALRAVRQ